MESGQLSEALVPPTCPECGGTLWGMESEEFLRFRCHVGHVYSAETMLVEQGDELESALWTAVRALAEKEILARRLTTRMRERGHAQSAARFEEQANDAARCAAILRQLLLENLGSLTRGPAVANGSGNGAESER